MLIFTCTDGQQGIRNPGVSDPYPTCASGGAWLEVDISAYEGFDPSSIDGGHATAAFGAGFVIVGTGMVLAFAVKVIVNAVRGLW